MRRRDRLIVLALVAVCAALVLWRLSLQDWDSGKVLPQRHRDVTLEMRLEGHGDDVVVRSLLPLQSERQRVTNELVTSGSFEFAVEKVPGARVAEWSASRVEGSRKILYSFTVRTEARRFLLEEGISRPERYPGWLDPHLEPTQNVQSDSPEIRALLEELVPPAERNSVTALLRRVYDHTHEGIRPARFTGTTDALTCLRLGESSCGGKSRLFVALVRAAGVPARLVGGHILKEGSWHASHVWAEAWVRGHWVPFCPLNGYFAELPEHYLVLHTGDRALFSRSADVNFEYELRARRILAPPADWRSVAAYPPLAQLNLWGAFEGVRIPVNLLKIILMIPFGVLAVVVCRNIFGIETFGTFMPALMAVAFRDTGLLWGTGLFLGIIGVGAALRFALGPFQLLHTPRLAVILTATVSLLLGLTYAAAAAGWVLPTRVSLFPIVIVTLTIERFAAYVEEDGATKAATVTLGTLVVVVVAYLVMTIEALQVAVLAFPELLLLVTAAFFVAGRWFGIRLSEYVRFRELLVPRGS